VSGQVDSIARAINVANAQPNNQWVANVNLIFTRVRRRNTFRFASTSMPLNAVLSAGMTVTVEIHDRVRRPAK
jgi:hypothetical protein